MILIDMLKNADIVDVVGDINQEIKDIACDSRFVTRDSAFICIKGFKSDGHNFVHEALESGAICIVSEHDITLPDGITLVKVNNSRAVLAQIASNFFGNPSSKFNLIGVTGTNGKTTTTYLVKSILEEAGHKVGLVGTIANMVGDKTIPTERTTPDSLELQRLFHRMVDEEVDSVVMEVSSHSLDLHRIDANNFDIGIFTNLTQDHLDYHVTLENYLDAKIKLFKMCKHGIINHDDKRSQKVIDEASCDVLTFGVEKVSDLKADNIVINAKGVNFELEYKNKKYKVNLAIPGKFTVYNALGAIGACLKLGLDMETILNGIQKVKGVPGRSEVVYAGDYTVIVDYAHTPDGIENILNSVREFAKGRIVTVFGCGGDRDKTKRPIMGEISGKLSHFCIVTSDNPRTEDPDQIVKEVEEGVKRTNCEYTVIVNRRDAIEYALKNAKKDDVILLAGKGHETYQILKEKTIHFDEKEIVQEILANM